VLTYMLICSPNYTNTNSIICIGTIYVTVWVSLKVQQVIGGINYYIIKKRRACSHSFNNKSYQYTLMLYTIISDIFYETKS
jgi:hypothetical protein